MFSHFFISFTTQGSTKIFKCPKNQICQHRIKVIIESKSLLVFAPDPTVCFDDSRFHQSVDIALASEDASVVFVDSITSGRKV